MLLRACPAALVHPTFFRRAGDCLARHGAEYKPHSRALFNVTNRYDGGILSDDSAARIRSTLDGLDYSCLTMSPGQLTLLPTLAASPDSPNLLLCPTERLGDLPHLLGPAGIRS